MLRYKKHMVVEMHRYCPPSKKESKDQHLVFHLKAKIVSEYDQEIPQSQTADIPMAPRGRAAQPSRDTRKTNKAKQLALSSPSR